MAETVGDGLPSERRSSTSTEIPSGQLAPILRAILQHNDQIVEQNQAILQLLNYHVQSLPEDSKTQTLQKSGKEIQRLSSQRTIVARHRADSVSQRAYEGEDVPPIPTRFLESKSARVQSSMWEAVLGDLSNQSPEFTKEYHRWERCSTIHEAFMGRHEWTSRSYDWAFPQLVEFLRREEAVRKCHSQVYVNDFVSVETSPITSAYNEARPRLGLLRGMRVPAKTSDGLRRRLRGINAEDPFGCNLLWQSLGGCACAAGAHQSTDIDQQRSLCMRGISIMDMSPRVLRCLLASTPRVDLSYMAAFIQRHLASTNWGKATPLRYGEHMSSFTLEYHFSFYYVTPTVSEAAHVKQDLRRQRKSARFGIDKSLLSKYIHEENLSFLLIGHFRDVSTCVQLAESYFKYDPYHVKDAEASEPSSFRPLRPDEPSAALYLSWISVALHHVLWRWQSAIDAVHSDIKSSQQIVFMDDRSDLMADDPSFSLSKTYFWALQAYKLFEDTISDTIATWRKFSEESLPALRDHRMSESEWSQTVSQIEDAIAELEKKVERIRNRVEEVKDLRRGLISASALFDSRTSVRQGENIRLLTYITLLFLPLSFATSIFGMQFMGSAKGYVYAFVSVLPAVTVLTALFVFNMENVISLWERTAEAFGGRLRKGMKNHNGTLWHERADALQEDLAATRAPVRKAHRETTAWIYLIFILESIFVTLPVSELAKASLLFRKLFGSEAVSATKRMEDGIPGDDRASVDPTVFEKINNSLIEERKKKRWERRKKMGVILLALEDFARATPTALRWILTGIIDIVRTLLVPIWSMAVLFEFYMLMFFFLLSSPFQRPSAEALKPIISQDRSVTSANSPRMRAFYRLGLDTVFPPTPELAKEPSKRESHARRQFSRAATQITLMSDQSEKSPAPHVDLVSPLPRSAPQIRHSPQLSPTGEEDRPKTFLSSLSFANKDPARDTMDFIEAMSLTSTSNQRTPMPRSPNGSTIELAVGGATTLSPAPMSPLPPKPTQTQAPAAGALDAEAPRSPTVDTESEYRPDTATTDGHHIPELTARVQSVQRMSARPVTQWPEGAGASTTQQGMKVSGSMEQRARLSAQDKSAARRSEVVEVEFSSRPPTPPPKESAGRPSMPKTTTSGGTIGQQTKGQEKG